MAPEYPAEAVKGISPRLGLRVARGARRSTAVIRWLVGSSVKFSRAVLAAAIVVMVVGVWQLDGHAETDALPEFAPPTVEVQTEALGLSAEEVEQLITVPMEQDLLDGIAWLDASSPSRCRASRRPHGVRARHRSLPRPPGRPGAHQPGRGPAQRVEAAADAPTARRRRPAPSWCRCRPRR